MDEEALIDKLMLFNSREREGIWKNLYEAEKKRNILLTTEIEWLRGELEND